MPDTQQLQPVLLQVVVLQRVHQTNRAPSAPDKADKQRANPTTPSQRLSARDPLQSTAAVSKWRTPCLALCRCPLGSDVWGTLAWVTKHNRGLWQTAALARHADFNRYRKIHNDFWRQSSGQS